MYGIVEDIEKLLAAKGFWYTLIVLNVLFVAGQPAIIVLTVFGVALLYFLAWIGRAVQRGGLGRVFWVAFLWLAFLMTWGTIGVALDAVIGYGHVLGLVLTIVLWVSLHRLRMRWQARCRRLEEEGEQTRQQLESERQTHRREREARLAEEKARPAADAQRQRDEARSRCDALYRLHAPEIRERFPRADFEEFVGRYMNDKQSAEDVERRATELQAVIEQHRCRIEPPKKKAGLAEIAQWFDQEKAQIDSSPLDDDDKAKLVAQLRDRYSDIQEKHIRSIEP